ncbi:MAG: hypothetical protein DRM99_02050 [Thermoplasmata archaeon]|nr:MAG: hypothetical protein DRM99_02050 [Thermoplasmata archaeon]
MKLQVKRWISQFVFLVSANLGAFGFKTGFCYPFFYCNACPAATSACPIRAIEISVKDSNWRFFLYPFLILGFIGVLFGRGVCGWACPIGLLQRATGRVARGLKKRFPVLKRIGELRVEHYFRYIKYLDVIGLAMIIPFFVNFMFTDICPVGVMVGTIPISILNPGEYTPNGFYYIAMVVFVLFLILIFVVERGWCRYFCPVGALLAPFNKISMYYVSVDKSKCTHCNLCSYACPMGIDIPNMDRSLECILCGKCVNACPKNLIEIKRG